MTPKPKFAAILLPAMLAACATAEPPKTASDLCLIDRPISFAQLPKAADGTRAADDPGNRADTDATVAEIIAHNARFDAACANPAG